MSEPAHDHPPGCLGTWDQFVGEWLQGQDEGFDRGEVLRQLWTLARLWPEALDALRAEPVRGSVVLVPFLHQGVLIRACEHLQGFPSVLARLRKGEESALAELQAAVDLRSLGMEVALDPELNGKRLDVVVEGFARRVYVEVIAPGSSAHVQKLAEIATSIAIAVKGTVKGMSVWLTFMRLPTAEDAGPTARYVEAIPVGEKRFDDQLQCHVSKLALTPDKPCHVAPLVEPGADPRAFCAFAGGGNQVVLYYPVSDSRAKRLFTNELKHFTHGECNVLMVDVSHIPGGASAWRPAVERRFQPQQNRRVSAVVLWDSIIHPGLRRVVSRWTVVPNPHALAPLPEDFRRELGRLPTSWEGMTP